MQYDKALAIRPGLAETWRASRDELQWAFRLRPDATFHDGRAVTAEYVVYSITRSLGPATRRTGAAYLRLIRGAEAFRAGRVATVTGVRALDRRTVEFTLTEPAGAPFPHALDGREPKAAQVESAKAGGCAKLGSPRRAGRSAIRLEAHVSEHSGSDIAELVPGDDAIAIRVQLPELAVALLVEFLMTDQAVAVEIQPEERRVDAILQRRGKELLDLCPGEQPIAIGVIPGKADGTGGHEFLSGNLAVAIQVVLPPRHLRLVPVSPGHSPASLCSTHWTALALPATRIGCAPRATDGETGDEQTHGERGIRLHTSPLLLTFHPSGWRSSAW